MRIVIETSEGHGDVRLEPASDAADGAIADGGAGPAWVTTGNGGGEDLPANDAGPPPDWLLEAVGAAQADGLQVPTGPVGDLDGTLAEDAGPGPVAAPVTPQEHRT